MKRAKSLDEMTFNFRDCIIPTVWCGNGNIPTKVSEDKKYSRIGTRLECMKKGFGAGMYSEKKKLLSPESLQNIKYVGEIFEQNFKKNNIHTLDDLVEFAKKKRSSEIKKVLYKVLEKKNKQFDKRAYNSVLLYLFHHGGKDLPLCRRISRS